MTTTTPAPLLPTRPAPLLPGRAVPYAVALGMSGTVGVLIPVSGRSVPGEVFASVALPVHRTPGTWVRADRPPVGCGTRCALWACKRGAAVVFAYLHEHDGELAPALQRRGDMDAPDGPPRPQGTRTLSSGRRQFKWTTAPDTSPIVGRPDSERLPETDDEGLQVVTMHDDPKLPADANHPKQWRQVDGGGGSKAPELDEWVVVRPAPRYSRVVVTGDLQAPARKGKPARYDVGERPLPRM